MNKSLPINTLLISGGTILNLLTGKSTKNDIIIVNGNIDFIGEFDEASYSGDRIDATGKTIVPGLLDMHVHLREPGREDEETIESGCKAAQAGGFTAVCSMPNTDPPADKREVVEYIIESCKNLLVDVFPIAAVSKGRKGEEITEIADLVDAGAVAFSDDGDPVTNSAVMRQALEYSKMFDVPIIDHCEDTYLFSGSAMNEGFVSTNLGLPGTPAIAEEIMVARNILLAKYVKGRIHIAHISTAGAIELVRKAKGEGVQITCEVTPHHFTLSDEKVIGFDTNTKMNPPLRTAADIEAIKIGLKDGTIDVIASDHAPHSIEEKDVEFQAAPFGIIGLETTLGLVYTELVHKGVISETEALRKMCTVPRSILRLPTPKIEKGELANLTIIDPKKEWKVDKKEFYSKSRNTPFDKVTLKGKICAVCNKALYSAFL